MEETTSQSTYLDRFSIVLAEYVRFETSLRPQQHHLASEEVPPEHKKEKMRPSQTKTMKTLLIILKPHSRKTRKNLKTWPRWINTSTRMLQQLSPKFRWRSRISPVWCKTWQRHLHTCSSQRINQHTLHMHQLQTSTSYLNIWIIRTISNKEKAATSILGKDVVTTATCNAMEGEVVAQTANGVETTPPNSNLCRANLDIKIVGVDSNHTTCSSIITIWTTVEPTDTM